MRELEVSDSAEFSEAGLKIPDVTGPVGLSEAEPATLKIVGLISV